MRLMLAGLLAISLVSPAAAAEVRNFFTPEIGGARVDACLSGGGCGKAAADAFCKVQGYDRAMIFQREQAASSRSIDSGQVCSKDCMSFRQVKCFTTKGDIAGMQKAL